MIDLECLPAGQSNLLTEFTQTIAEGLRSKTLNTCYRWATVRRVMGGDFAGNYSAKYHPWVVGLHDSWADFNWVMKGAQLGVTEVAINRALYILDRMQRDVLYALPTVKGANEFSKARFGAALAYSPYLKGMFTSSDAVEIKCTSKNTLYIRGSSGKDSLISVPVAELILDEVDRMSRRELSLAMKRVSGQLEKHVWGISTPTLPGRGIDAYYQDSTREHFRFQCPACSRHTELVWPDCLEIVGESLSDPRCKESYLKCRECKGRIEHLDKPNFLAKGYWESTNSKADKSVRGFHISQLYSYTVTPGELAQFYLRGTVDEYDRQEFFNSMIGIPYVGDGARVDDVMLTRAVRKHSKNDQAQRPVKFSGRLIVMGVDRGKWNHVEIREYLFDKLAPEINQQAIAVVLWEGKILDEDFDTRLAELMVEWQVLACVMDADPGRMEARRFARQFPGHVWLCQYRPGVTAKELAISEEDSGAPVVTAERSHWLSASLGRFKTDPSRIYLPCDVSDTYRAHMKALAATYVKTERDNNPVLKYLGSDEDHFAHAGCYAEIALPLAAARQSHQDIATFL